MELIYTIRYEKDEFGRIDVPSAIFSLSDDVYEHCDFLCEEYRKRVANTGTVLCLTNDSF